MKIAGGVQLIGGVTLLPGGSSPTPVSEKIIAGAFFANSQQGKAYVYNTDGSSQVSISASDGNSDDKFGFSVAVSGSKVAIGAYGSPNNTGVGAVYVFDADGSNPDEISSITISNILLLISSCKYRSCFPIISFDCGMADISIVGCPSFNGADVILMGFRVITPLT